MINSKNSIACENSVWDLHIHTCECPKGSSEFSNLSLNEYLDTLCNIFKKYPDLKMISFTDHNHISKDVYSGFLERNTGISVIIGVEVDTFLDKKAKEENDFKHIIFYFDNEKFDLNTHTNLINKKLKESPVVLDEFLRFLITEIKVPFLISPHFMKQGSRAVDFDWDEEKTKKEIDKYIDQMCCFWETSNTSNIQHAICFLEEFDKGNKVSVISFSDSNSSSKLEGFLTNPTQYFSSLPTFNGLRLAGSDCRRICFCKKAIDSERKANFIGRVKLNNYNDIYLSAGLNSIVGGRGTGKSLLVDGIAYKLDNKKIEKIFEESDGRIEYLDKMNLEVFDMNDTLLDGHDFKFDYYNQGYAQELFKKNNDLVSTEYFKERFMALEIYNKEEIKGEIVELLSFEEEISQSFENISSLDTKIALLSEEKNDLKFNSLKLNKCITPPDYETLDGLLTKAKVIPQELAKNKNIIRAKNNFEKAIYTEISLYNKQQIEENFECYLINAYKELVSSLNSKKKAKKDSLCQLKSAFNNTFLDINNRVALINKILSLDTDSFNDESSTEADGYQGRKFIFSRQLICENIFDYLLKIFGLYLDSNKLRTKGINNKNDIKNLKEIIYQYCFFAEDVIQESKTVEDLYNELKTLKSFVIDIEDNIYVKEGEKMINLKHVSPGTRANYLLEYIVFSESGRPLIIDQPEDNIDNQTIYCQLTSWFNSLKSKRQVLVVTHDANIVVNSDSENIVICKQNDDDVFDYKNGALEFESILDDISILLDGGKEAIERRLIKYGK